MALNSQTAAALKEALQAVIEECGDDPQYAELIDALQTAEHAIPAVEGEHEAPEHEGADEGDDDEYSFEHAERKHKAARKSKPKGENPFADKDDE